MLGGTFDPVHVGHLVLGEAAREQLGLDRVIFVPAGHPWRKPDRNVSPAGHRLAMLKLAVGRNSAFEVSTLEIEREGPSYSEITLAELQRANPGAELVFILGQDALADLPNWHDPRRVVELATLAVAEREGAESAVGEEPALAALDARIISVRMPVIAVSSSDLRRRVREGRSIRYLVPDEVAGYINQHGLYRD
jgi:nicotinate-nucleotide adenylyltransferase